MIKRVGRFLSKLTILIGVVSAASVVSFGQNDGAREKKKTKEISDKRIAKQLAKTNKRKRKHIYKIQDKPTRKRMKKTYKNTIRRRKGKRLRRNRLV